MFGLEGLGQILGQFALLAIAGIVIGMIISFAIQCLILYIGMWICGIEDKGTFFTKHIFKIILVGIISTFLSNALIGILGSVSFGMLGTLLPAAVAGAIEYFCHYHLTFRDDPTKIRKSMSVCYAVLAVVGVII